jgi:DMSO/TMAO reductase YedYZ molybdopterin-dependent catalytic subunit
MKLRPAIAGILAAASGIAAAELVAAVIRPEASPLVTIGGTVIDATPTPLKEFAVRTVGTYDKPQLLSGILVVLVLVAALAGVLGSRRRPLGLGLIGLLGFAGVVAAVTRPTAQPFDALPALVASVVAVVLLNFLLDRAVGPIAAAPAKAPSPSEPSSPSSPSEPVAPSEAGSESGAGMSAAGVAGPPSRRAFLNAAGLVAGGTVVAGLASTGIRTARGTQAAKLREAVQLPSPASTAGPRITTPGFYTPVDDFYRVDTALTVPRVDSTAWQLKITGMVDRPATLSFDDLLRRGLIERDITLNCVSNEVGGPYIGTTRWLGVPLAPLLREVGIRSGADQVVARSVEGMTIGTPVETLLDGREAMLAVAMDGQPLPLEHGFPVRMLTPGLYGYAGSCKWISGIELSTFDDYDAYWVKRGWARRAPVKTASRIDKPAAFAKVNAGPVTVAGVAWAQGRGISKVEVQVDGGDWNAAELLPVPSAITWVQWRWTWNARAGGHTLRVRATDGTGEVQAEQRTTPFPSGATGWHTLSVQVS